MATCTNKSCNSGLPGRWQPILLLWPDGFVRMQCQPVSVTVNNHLVCDNCQKKATVAQLIPMDHFKSIQTVVVGHGKRKPVLATAKLEYFVPDSFGKDFSGELKL